MTSAIQDHIVGLVKDHSWVFSSLDEIEADFLRFYHIFDPFDSIEGHRFFRLVKALPHYGGAVTAKAHSQRYASSDEVAPLERKQPARYNYESLQQYTVGGGRNVHKVDLGKSEIDQEAKEALRRKLTEDE